MLLRNAEVTHLDPGPVGPSARVRTCVGAWLRVGPRGILGLRDPDPTRAGDPYVRMSTPDPSTTPDALATA